MDSDIDLQTSFQDLALGAEYSHDSNWVFVSLNEKTKQTLQYQAKRLDNLRIFLLENSMLKDLNGTVYSFDTAVKPFNTYFFIENEDSFENCRNVLTNDVFIFAPNNCLSGFGAICISENQHFSYSFLINARELEGKLTPQFIFILLVDVNNQSAVNRLIKAQTRIIKSYKMKKNDENLPGKGTNERNIGDIILASKPQYFELISNEVEILNKFYSQYEITKNYKIEELIDSLNNSYRKGDDEKTIVFAREFLIAGYFAKIKEIIDLHSEKNLGIFQSIKHFSYFILKFKIENLLEEIIGTPKNSKVLVTFLYDYFVNSNINNLKEMEENSKMTIRYLECGDDPIIFELIDKNYKNHVLNLLQNYRFRESASKLVKMKVEARDNETAWKLFRRQIELTEIPGLNESNFVMKENIIKNTYSAYPNFDGLKILLENIIPSSFFLLSNPSLKMKFIGKNLVGGNIILKSYIIDNIKKNMKILSDVLDIIRDPLLIIEIEIVTSNGLDAFMLLENSLKRIDLPQDKCKIYDEDSIPNNFPYKNIPYHQLSKLSSNDFDKVIFVFKSEKVIIPKRKLLDDILKISHSIFFLVLTHELLHGLRLKFTRQQLYSIKTPEKTHYKAEFCIDKAIYGDSIIAASINTRNFTIEISRKILNLVELTPDEAISIFPSNRGSNMKEGVWEFEDIDDEETEYVEYMCTGRTIKKKIN